MSRRRVMMLLFGSGVPSLLTTLKARATYYENESCTTATLTKIENIE